MTTDTTQTPSPPELTPDNFINRELSTIAFQRRVLAQAAKADVPLLERVKYAAIVGNNLDEFFMVRVASYLQKVQLGITSARPDGYTPSQLLERIRVDADKLISDHRRILKDLLGELEAEGISIVDYDDLPDDEKEILQAYFREAIYPVLTPLAADHARPFPFISNLSLNLGVLLRRNVDPELDFARIKIPVRDVLPRLVNLQDVLFDYGGVEIETMRFVWIEDLIMNNLDYLFPGMDIVEAFPFRVLRNADIDYEQEQDEDLRDVMSVIEQGVRERRFGSVVRISVPDDISDRMLTRLKIGLELHNRAFVYRIKGALGSSDLFELAGVKRYDLQYEPFVPRNVELLSREFNIFDQIAQRDVVVHHPYESFTPVEDFFRTAAKDPKVLAIKATLYRVGKNSPIVEALLDARDNDKQVTVLVELKARFDEENNLTWARALEDKGVHVVYGVEELAVKTHAKISLVVRREKNGVRRYLHLGTGNYNASTARLYGDFGLFTCHDVLADDATRLFNRLTGYAPETSYTKLLVAPDYLFDTLYSLIDNEIQAAKEGREARLIFKMNQLEEDLMIQKLYEASQAGVKIDLLVRGHCCLLPGIPGVSDNIRVVSIIGRFLEHARAYYFRNAPDEQQLLLGSADLMRRNLYNRVEVVFPILNQTIRMKILRTLATQLLDNQGAWELQPDRTYKEVERQEGDTPIDSQKIFTENSFGLDLLP